MPTVKIISGKEIDSLLTLPELIPKIEQMFLDYYEGKGVVFPIVREQLKKQSGIFGVKSGYSSNIDMVGYKSGGFWEKNVTRNLSNHQSVILLHDAETGVPVSMMDGNVITVLRTGAANAVALKYLVRKDARVLAVIGTGMQGMIQTRAALEVLTNLEQIYCYDQFQPSMEKYMGNNGFWNPDSKPVKVTGVSEEKLALNHPDGYADVVITTTPSWEAHVRKEWIQPGMHISAIGADTKGKQEVDPEILARGLLVVDDWAQASTVGESQHAFQKGMIDKPFALLSEVVAGVKPGRQANHELTIFDATGIALQDIYTAHHVLQLAQKNHVGTDIEL